MVSDHVPAGVVEVRFALRSVSVKLRQGRYNITLAHVQGIHRGRGLQIKTDDKLMQIRRVISNNCGAAQILLVKLMPNGVNVRLICELHVHERAAAEIDAVSQTSMPDHGADAYQRQQQRGADKVPLLP